MGNACTSLQGISSNAYLKRLCSPETICENDPFWNALLAFSLVDLDLVALNSSNSKLLEDTVNTLCKNLAINNVKTGNFRTLVVYFLHRLREVTSMVAVASGNEEEVPSSNGSSPPTNPFTWQVLNALFIIKTVCKYFIQNLSEEVIIQQFLSLDSNSQEQAASDDTIACFIQGLCDGLIQLPIHPFSILLHLEMVNTLITLLASAMYQSDSPANMVFYIQIMEGKASLQAGSMVRYLLQAYTHSDSLPSYVYKEDEGATLSSTLWSVVTLGMGSTSSPSEVRRVNLGTQGLLLLHVLANHSETDNPYKMALTSLMSQPEDEKLVKPDLLYNTICNHIHQEETTLLLYMLIHENQVMKQYILSRMSTEQLRVISGPFVEKLCEPVLRLLYNHSTDGSSDHTQHVYLALIILLILTEDDTFAKELFNTKLADTSVKWYKERQLHDVNLGDIFILVIIKAMQYNMAHTKDRYLHTNCLATLANISSKFTNLHAYVCQRLVMFYCALAKRHTKTKEKLQLSLMKASPDDEANDLDSLTLTSDLEAIEEMITMVIEIFNSCLTHAVHHNANLVHVMLCHKEEFEHFRSVESFQNILQNIHTVLEQFDIRLKNVLGDDPRSVQEVIQVIEDGLKTFRRSTFVKLPDLKFKYVEEADPGRFFVPYSWQIVCKASNLHFKSAGKRT